MTVDDVNETWGMYYYMSALNKLRKAGLLNEAIRPETLKKLQQKLDWRPFVRVPEYTVINLPTNYLGVAFSIARLRMLLGWEDASGASSCSRRSSITISAIRASMGFQTKPTAPAASIATACC